VGYGRLVLVDGKTGGSCCWVREEWDLVGGAGVRELVGPSGGAHKPRSAQCE
jgi:hypothetical protein